MRIKIWIKVQMKKFKNRKKKHNIKILLKKFEDSLKVQEIAVKIADDMGVEIVSYRESSYSIYSYFMVLKCRDIDKVSYIKRFLNDVDRYIEKVEFS